MKLRAIFSIICVLAAFGLTSCATFGPAEAVRIGMQGIGSIGILPFGFAGDAIPGSPLEAALYRNSDAYHYRTAQDEAIAGTLTADVQNALAAMKRYAIVGPVELRRTAGQSKESGPQVDAYVTGEITRFDISYSHEYSGLFFARARHFPGVMIVDRELVISYVVRLIRASDGAVLGEISRKGWGYDRWPDLDLEAEKAPVLPLMQSIVSDQMVSITRALEPMPVEESGMQGGPGSLR